MEAEMAQPSHSMRDTAIERLYEAATLGSMQLLNTLIQEDPNIIQKYLVSNSNSESPLHVSVTHGHLEFTRLLLDQKPELVVEIDALQRTPLHLASANGDVEMVRALLEKNTSACLIRDLNGMIPLHYSATKGHIQVMQDLIHARPQSVTTKFSDGRTILHLCVKDNQLEAMRLLIQSVIDDKDFLHAVDNNGNTILDLSMLLRQVEMVRYLLSIPGIEVAGTRSSSNIEIAETTSAQEGAQELERVPPAEDQNNTWYDFMINKGNWSDTVQVNLLVATVIATVTFQCVINPPGGVLQDEVPIDNLPFSDDTVFTRGTSVMLYHSIGRQYFYLFLHSNTISFTAAAFVILFILLPIPKNNRFAGWCTTIAMCLAVLFLIVSYMLAIWIVNNGGFTKDQASALLNGMVFYIDPAEWKYLGILPWIILVGLMVGLMPRMMLFFLQSTLHCYRSFKLKKNQGNERL